MSFRSVGSVLKRTVKLQKLCAKTGVNSVAPFPYFTALTEHRCSGKNTSGFLSKSLPNCQKQRRYLWFFSTATQVVVHGYMTGFNEYFGCISAALEHICNSGSSLNPWSSGPTAVIEVCWSSLNSGFSIIWGEGKSARGKHILSRNCFVSKKIGKPVCLASEHRGCYLC